MFGSLYQILFYVVPSILIAVVVLSIHRYKSAKEKNEAVPGTFTQEEIKRRKVTMGIVSVIAGTLLAVVIGFTVLLFLAVAFM